MKCRVETYVKGNTKRLTSNKGISKSEIVPLLAASIKSGKLIGTQGKKSNKPRQVYEVNFNGKVFKNSNINR